MVTSENEFLHPSSLYWGELEILFSILRRNISAYEYFFGLLVITKKSGYQPKKMAAPFIVQHLEVSHMKWIPGDPAVKGPDTLFSLLGRQP